VLEVEVERVVNFKLALDARGAPAPPPAPAASRTHDSSIGSCFEPNRLMLTPNVGLVFFSSANVVKCSAAVSVVNVVKHK